MMLLESPKSGDRGITQYRRRRGRGVVIRVTQKALLDEKSER